MLDAGLACLRRGRSEKRREGETSTEITVLQATSASYESLRPDTSAAGGRGAGRSWGRTRGRDGGRGGTGANNAALIMRIPEILQA